LNSPTPPIKLACIIDDDDVYIHLIKKIVDLKKLCENLLIFKNGKEALEYFKAIIENTSNDVLPEIILLDLNMPVMDGWKFLKKFTKISSPVAHQTTLYIVSSSIDSYEIEKAKSYDLVTDYLVKPITIDSLETLFLGHSA